MSTIQRIADYHAPVIWEQEAEREIVVGTAAGVPCLGEMDASMGPVVEVSADAPEKRRGKRVRWKEVRLTIVHPKGRVTPVFGEAAKVCAATLPRRGSKSQKTGSRLEALAPFVGATSDDPVTAPVTALFVTAWINGTTKARENALYPLGRGRSSVPTAPLCSNGESFRVAGGQQILSKPCWRCGLTEPTGNGKPLDVGSKKKRSKRVNS